MNLQILTSKFFFYWPIFISFFMVIIILNSISGINKSILSLSSDQDLLVFFSNAY